MINCNVTEVDYRRAAAITQIELTDITAGTEQQTAVSLGTFIDVTSADE
jgi:hypothetical protein